MKRISVTLPVTAVAIVAVAQTPDARPNILICMADDAGHMGSKWSPWINTPAFDRVAREGVNFMNAYTCNSKSAPSRAAVITGRNSWQLEAAANHWCNFPLKFRSFPEGLKEKGYHTGYTGKGWGPGIALNADSTNRELTGKAYNKVKLTPPTSGINKIDYAANFKKFLEAREYGKPFCFWYGSREPHRAYEYGSGQKFGKTHDMISHVPGYWPDNDTVRNDMLDYAVEIEYFDNHLQQMLDILEKEGELDNTIVIVTSDHGMPFPRCKGNDYLDAMKVPLAVMWGKNVKNPGREITDMVSLIDLAPTILEACGYNAKELGMQPITGNSFMDILEERPKPKFDPKMDRRAMRRMMMMMKDRSFVLMGRERHDPGRPGDVGYPIRAMLQDSILYIHNFEPERWPAGNPSTGYMDCDGSPTKTEILRCRAKGGEMLKYWELCMGFRPREEMYNVAQDPDCINNLATEPQYRKMKEKMRNNLFMRLTRQEDPRMRGAGDIFDTYPNMCPAHDYYDRISKGETGIPTGWINNTDFERD